MRASNFDIEIAERRVEQEKQVMVNLAAASLMPAPNKECEWCGDEIPADRKRVMPSAKRCIDCQALKEAC